MSERKKRSPTGDYAVGYCRPPEATRFQPGKRSNSKRRMRSKDFISVLEALMSENVEVITRGKRRRITAEELMYRVQKEKALKGDLKAAEFLVRETKSQRLGRGGQQVDGDYDLSLLSKNELQTLLQILSKAVRKRKSDEL